MTGMSGLVWDLYFRTNSIRKENFKCLMQKIDSIKVDETSLTKPLFWTSFKLIVSYNSAFKQKQY